VTVRPDPYAKTGMLTKIISGGQTGADRAALDFAIKHKIPHGGRVPRGRMAEDGSIPDIYQLREMRSPSYSARTEQNVKDADGTLIVSHGRLTGGSSYTAWMARKHSRPLLHLDMTKLDVHEAAGRVRAWLEANSIRTLNVAGPRQSTDPDIYDTTMRLLEATVEDHY